MAENKKQTVSENEDNVLLRVENLSQHFGELKAVDNVSFDIKKGEVFGLVGESGCGKTTTGRSIIKLYNITSGNIYFKGHRIGAGTLSYKNAIKNANQQFKKEVDELKKSSDTDKAEKIAKKKADLKKFVAEQKALIASAKNDNKNVDRDLITQIQMIFQDPIASLDPRMTVREIISEGLVIKGMKDKAKIDEMVYEVLETVGLVRDHAGRYPHEFSGGQRQRIGVARAVIMKPELIIADEPVSALDVSIQAQIINLLEDLQNDMGLTYLFISHDLSVVEHISDDIGVMYLGSMVESGKKERIFDNPMHPYTQALFSAVPVPDPNVKMNRIILKGDIPSPANPPKGCKFHTRCRHCMDVCKEVAPKFKEYEPDHFVACHLYSQD